MSEEEVRKQMEQEEQCKMRKMVQGRLDTFLGRMKKQEEKEEQRIEEQIMDLNVEHKVKKKGTFGNNKALSSSMIGRKKVIIENIDTNNRKGVK